MLASHRFRICYENWCFATHGQTWEQVWGIVQEANRPNIGLCLDTYQEAGAQWADPTTESGMIEEVSKTALYENYTKSLEKLASTVPAEKIYIFQISDGYKPMPRITNTPDQDGTRPRGRWCMSYRPMPYNGGYLPIVPVTSAVLKTGFRGIFSIEVFDGGQDGRGKKKEASDYTRKAMASLQTLLSEAFD